MVKIDNNSSGIINKLSIASSAPVFNLSGKYIFFKLEGRRDSRKTITNAASVDVWSYQDSVIMSQQLALR